MLLKSLIKDIPEVACKGDPGINIRGLSHDSRTVLPGDLFVALRGARTDGNRYLSQAIERGAVALASEENLEPKEAVAVLTVRDARRFLAEAALIFYGDPAAHFKLVAITGTNGKTTTAYLLHSIFRQAGLRSCLAGTLGLYIGEQRSSSAYTTPEAPELFGFLRQALDGGCTHGALEASSHALAGKRVYGAKFAAGVFSNLSPEHLDFHGDMESYYRAKRLLFDGGGRNQIDCAVINTDDAYGRRLAAETRGPMLCYGAGPAAHVRLMVSRKHIDGTDLHIGTPLGDVRLRMRLIGTPNIYNVLAAVSAAVSLDIPLDSIRGGIESVAGVPGRMELVRADQPFTLVVDYAHTPDALEKLLQTIHELPHRRIITVFGCGGDRDPFKRPVMGEIAGRLSAMVIITSDNPRTEDPQKILAEIEPGTRKTGADCRIVADRRRAIGIAVSAAEAGDVVVIAGKGHEDYQILGTQSVSFDDRAVARELIAQMQTLKGARN